MAIVEVKPVEKLRWHTKGGKEAFARPVTIEALVSIQTGQYTTGLSAEDRERLEAQTGYNLSPDYTLGSPHKFWNSPSALVKLDHKTNVFDTSKPLDEIKIAILKASDLVANSQKDLDEGLTPGAIFVIFDEQEEVAIKASKAAIRRKVIVDLAKLTTARKAEIVQILSGISVRHQSEEYIDLQLDEEIESKGAQKVLTIMQRDKARTALHATILEALQKGILRKEGSSIYFMDDQLGFDLESTIDYFKDKNNQVLKAQVLERLNN